MTISRERLLSEMGLGPLWRLRGRKAPSTLAAPLSAKPVSPQVKETAPALDCADIEALDWQGLTTAVSACTACGLCQQRQQAVLGSGDQQADWLFVGEAPAAEDDLAGEPFVSPAGKLLDAMLAAIALERGERVYYTNAVKCHPPAGRTPEAKEMEQCRVFLQRQIELIQPKLIVALGRPAAMTLLQQEVKISASRGQIYRYGDIPLIITYHPAYLLRNLSEKAKSWEDLCFIRRHMAAL